MVSFTKKGDLQCCDIHEEDLVVLYMVDDMFYV